MKLRDYKRHTFKLCMAWVYKPNVRNTDRLVTNLRRWSRFTGQGRMAAYPSQPGDTALGRTLYCCDRMNTGRAKGILKLIDLEATRRMERAFSPDPVG